MVQFISRFEEERGEIKTDDGQLIYFKVTPHFETIDSRENIPSHRVEGSCFLFDDYSCLLKPGDTFYHIAKIEVNENARRKGVGTKLVDTFFKTINPQSVVLQAGITTEELYNRLRESDTLCDYIYENIVPFWEKMGFTDVNGTTFYFEESVPMLWPKSQADEAKRIADEFKKRHETA
ncbi:hypothetical protein J6A31_06420 [bacterium]|nr:hypothetical protein [bacterium]